MTATTQSVVILVDSQGLLVAWSAPFGRLCRQQPTANSGDHSDRLVLVEAPFLSPAVGTALTHRSCEVLRLVAAGMTNNEIAQHLSVSISAVKKYLKRLFEHFGVRRRFELLAVVETIDSHNRLGMQ